MNFNNIAVGVDIEDVERFKKKDEAFIKRVFTPIEIMYCNSTSKSYQHYAVRFCAKEAIFKALSNFGEKGIVFNEIEVYHDKNNVPCVKFLSDLGKKYRAKLSLAHDKTKAIAYVIICKSDKAGEK